MVGLNRDKSEAFVNHMVAGLAPKAAALMAGYSISWANKAARKLKRSDIGRMIAKRQWEVARAGADLAPIIAALIAAGDAAASLKSAAAFVAAKGLYAEAARLKGLPPPPTEPPEPPPPEMTEAEWMAMVTQSVERVR